MASPPRLRKFSTVLTVGSMLLVLLSSSLLLTSEVSAKTIDEASLHEVEDKVQDIVTRVMPATVGLGSVGGRAGGSGVIVNKDGLILTAAHVVAAIGDEVVVYFPDGRRVKAKKLGADNNADAAMVQITEAGEYPFVEVGDSDTLRNNDWLIAMGHAGGFQSDRTPPVRLGRLLGRTRSGFVTSDCTLIGGDSGGPLFDIKGNVVGIHSNIGNSLTSNNHVPIKAFHRAWQRMVDGDTWGSRFGPTKRADPKQAVLGIMPTDASADEVELEVLPGSPAATAGIKSGDVLLKIDGKEVETYRTVRKVMAKRKSGDEVAIVVLRDEKEMEFTVKALRRDEVARNVERATRKLRSQQPKAKPKPSEPSATEEELDALLRAHIDRAKAKGGQLQLDQDQVKELGGVRALMRRMRKILDPKEIASMIREEDRENDDHLLEIMSSFEDIVENASLSVVALMQNDRQVALGTAVHANGYAITKSSEIKSGKGQLYAVVDELTKAKAKVIRRFPKYDLALVKIDADLVPVRWYEPDPSLGSIVAAAGTNDRPLAVGVISVAERNLSGSDKGYLGVALGPGIEISSVQDDSPAAKAGLESGDKITKLNGRKMKDLEGFVEAIKGKHPGDTIQLEYLRGKKTQKAEAKLASRAALPMFDGSGRYPTGGELSTQRSGYPNALQTDLPLRPEDCGSPIVDLQGRVLGVNVARAGRIKSYAIPADTIEELIRDEKFE